MGQPAARVGDMHVCPMFDGPKPHVGGPVLPPGVINVLIGGMPAATVGTLCFCASAPDVIVKGSFTVLIGGRPAARMGDSTAHGGVVTTGCPTVLIGDFGIGGVGTVAALPPNVLVELLSGMTQEMARTMKQAVALANGAAKGIAFCEVCS